MCAIEINHSCVILSLFCNNNMFPVESIFNILYMCLNIWIWKELNTADRDAKS